MFATLRYCRVLALLPALVLIGLQQGCSTNPATGRTQFAMLTMDQERALGAEAAPQFIQEFGGPVSDQTLQAYVTDIGNRMAAQTEGDFPSLPWQFTLLDSSVVNAFALPGGHVFITRGLAQRLTNEAQLAGVLGHEIGHVTARHGNQRISAATLFTAGITVAAVMVGDQSDRATLASLAVPALSVGGQVVLLKFGRDEELEADALGVRYMSRVGYDPIGQLQVMEVLAEAAGDGGRGLEWLSTHPYPERRIRDIGRLIQSQYADTQNSATHGTFEQRYRDVMLSRLGQLPAPRHSARPEEVRATLAALGALGGGTCSGCTACTGVVSAGR